MFRGLSALLSAWMAVIFVFAAFVGWHLFRDMSVIYDRAIAVDQSNHRSHHLHAWEMQIRQMVAYANQFLITGSDRYIRWYHTASDALDRALAAEQETMAVDSVEVIRALKPIHRTAEKIFTLPFATGNMEGPILMQELDGQVVRLSQQLSARHHTMDQEVNRSMHMVSALYLDVRDDALLALLLLLLLLLVGGVYLYRRVVRPLTLLKAKVSRIGEGEFFPDCPDFGDNEIGALSRALNHMGEALTERDNELVQAKSIAAHQEKMHALGLMTASIAHEVGNPLAATAVSLDVCCGKLQRGDVNTAMRYLETAVEELRRTENMIRNVLDFGRHASSEEGRVMISDVIESALHLVKLSRHAKKLRFEVSIAEDVPKAWGSEDMMRQVLVNLLLNAADVSQQHTTVMVSAALFAGQQEMVAVDVIDQGGGIPESMCAKIFSPLFTSKPKGEGTGLGLAISRDLMRRMQGDLLLVDNSDKGCRFRMLMPVAKGGEHVAVIG